MSLPGLLPSPSPGRLPLPPAETNRRSLRPNFRPGGGGGVSVGGGGGLCVTLATAVRRRRWLLMARKPPAETANKGALFINPGMSLGSAFAYFESGRSEAGGSMLEECAIRRRFRILAGSWLCKLLW